MNVQGYLVGPPHMFAYSHFFLRTELFLVIINVNPILSNVYVWVVLSLPPNIRICILIIITEQLHTF